jgi:hypothetical protein
MRNRPEPYHDNLTHRLLSRWYFQLRFIERYV